MVVVKTINESDVGTKQNTYICPHCEKEIQFGHYIRTICDECSGNIFNVEKLLDSASDVSKVNYYTNEKI